MRNSFKRTAHFLHRAVIELFKNLPRIALFTVAFYAIFWVGSQLYYKYADSKNFLDYYYAKVDDTPVGTNPLLTLCRTVHYRGIKIEAARTFIYYDDGDNQQPVAEYEFEANVEKTDTNCQTLRLAKQPQRAGTYRIHTEIAFYVNGFKKTDSYDSNKYEMTETSQSIEAQIEVLQRQIDSLRAQLKAERAKENSSSNTTIIVPQQSQTNTDSSSKSSGSDTASNGSSNGNSGGNNDNSNGNGQGSEQTCLLGLICL